MTQQQEQQIPDPAENEDVPQPVEVEIETPVSADAPPATPPQKPKPRPRHEVRIQTLAHERDEARDYSARLQRELEQARKDAAEARAAREQAERAGMTNYAARVEADVAAAKAALRSAREAKDDDAEIAAQEALAKAAAAAADVDAWRATQPKEGEQRQPPQAPRQEPQRQQQPEFEPPPEEVRNFMAENSWFSAVKYDERGRPLITQDGRPVPNPDFDEEMHEEAMSEHRRIAREVRLGRLAADFINSPEYFERITNRVAQTFPSDDGDQEPPPQRRGTPPMQQARQPVAPAQRQSQPGTPPRQTTKMRLDGEQADFVRKLVDNGTMIYPRNHPDASKRGQKMSYEDAFVTYAKNLASDQKQSA